MHRKRLTPWNTRDNLTGHEDRNAAIGKERQENSSSHDDQGKGVGLLVPDHVAHDSVENKTEHGTSLGAVHETGLPVRRDLVAAIGNQVPEIAVERWEGKK